MEASDIDCSMATSVQESLSGTEQRLHDWCRSGNCAAARQLLYRRPQLAHSRNCLGRSPLHLAASRGHCDIVQLLLQHRAKVDLADKYGMTPVMWAVYFCHADAVQLLVRRGASIHKKNKLGMGCAHIAAERDSPQLLRLLLTAARRASVCEADGRGRTPLLVAAAAGSQLALEFLLQQPDVQLQDTDQERQSSLHLAAAGGWAAATAALLRHRQLRLICDCPDAEGRTPLHVAAAGAHPAVVACLLQAGCDASIPAADGRQPFLLAAASGCGPALQVLAEHRAEVDACDQSGGTALHCAARGGNPQLLRLLLQLGCSHSAADARQQTPLHVAAEQNSAEAAEALLLAGADTAATDRDGKSPLALAAQGSCVCIVDMIVVAERTRQLGHSCAQRASLRQPAQASWQQLHAILWRLAHRHLRCGEWQQLAQLWQFSQHHVDAIAYDWLGDDSHRQHGYRLLLAWLHCLQAADLPGKQLYESLRCIGRQRLAERTRRHIDRCLLAPGHGQSCCLQ